jgi:hypothetical protein
MIAEKKRETKQVASEEPNSRFYVRRWDATPEEEAEISQYIRERKGGNNANGKEVNKNKAEKIREKLVR